MELRTGPSLALLPMSREDTALRPSTGMSAAVSPVDCPENIQLEADCAPGLYEIVIAGGGHPLPPDRGLTRPAARA